MSTDVGYRKVTDSGIQHLLLVAEYPPQRRKLAPVQVVLGTEILDAHFVFDFLHDDEHLAQLSLLCHPQLTAVPPSDRRAHGLKDDRQCPLGLGMHVVK